MDCDHKYLAYIKLFNVQLNNIMFVALKHSGTIYLQCPEGNYYVKDIEDIASIYSGCIPIIIVPALKGPIKPSALSYQDITKKISYILDKDDVQYLKRCSDNEFALCCSDVVSINVIIIMHITQDTNFDYINVMIEKFHGADIIIYESASGLHSKIISGNILGITAGITNHMIAFLQGLNYIYSLNLKYDYVFKLYSHPDFVINYEMTQIKITNHDVIGYPAIKYDYLDNNYVHNIITEYGINQNAGIHKIYGNIKTLASKFTLPAQINRKSKDWANISKKTNKSYIPSSVFIIKYDKIPFEIIDCYADIINIVDSYEHQNYINAINKIFTIFEY